MRFVRRRFLPSTNEARVALWDDVGVQTGIIVYQGTRLGKLLELVWAVLYISISAILGALPTPRRVITRCLNGHRYVAYWWFRWLHWAVVFDLECGRCRNEREVTPRR